MVDVVGLVEDQIQGPALVDPFSAEGDASCWYPLHLSASDPPMSVQAADRHIQITPGHAGGEPHAGIVVAHCCNDRLRRWKRQLASHKGRASCAQSG